MIWIMIVMLIMLSGLPDSGVRIDGNYSHLVVSSSAPYDSLVGYWAFDGDSENTETTTHYDWTSNDNDGTGVANAVVNESGCVYGGCLQLDGVGLCRWGELMQAGWAYTGGVGLCR